MSDIAKRLREIADKCNRYNNQPPTCGTDGDELRAIAKQLEAQPAGDPAELPALPTPIAYGEWIDIPGAICEAQRPRYFSVNQMRDYAIAARDAAVREAVELTTQRMKEIAAEQTETALLTFSQGLVKAGFTARPTGKSAGGLMREDE